MHDKQLKPIKTRIKIKNQQDR